MRFCWTFLYQDAVGHSYVAQVAQHSSQTDASRGFGGKFGVQKDRVDQVGYTYYTLHHTLLDRIIHRGVNHIYMNYIVNVFKWTICSVFFFFFNHFLHYVLAASVWPNCGSSPQSALGFEYKGEVEQHASQKGTPFHTQSQTETVFRWRESLNTPLPPAT